MGVDTRLRPSMNLLKAMAAFEEIKKGTSLPAELLAWLRKYLRRDDNRRNRLARYAQRNASYPYSSRRQQQRQRFRYVMPVTPTGTAKGKSFNRQGGIR